jgi:hypothetical protein
MILDKENLFSSDQAITGTEDSDNVIDLGAITSPAPSASLRAAAAMVMVQVTADFNTLTTLTVTLTTSAAEAMSNAVTHFSVAVALADLTAGKRIFLPIPEEALRYARLTYTVGGSNPSTGTITAGITFDAPTGVC